MAGRRLLTEQIPTVSGNNITKYALAPSGSSPVGYQLNNAKLRVKVWVTKGIK